MKYRVEDMTCGHCEKAIKSQLTKTLPAAKVSVDLAQKIVQVEGATDDEIKSSLKDIGYHPQKVE